jgi:hypothetical protein
VAVRDVYLLLAADDACAQQAEPPDTLRQGSRRADEANLDSRAVGEPCSSVSGDVFCRVLEQDLLVCGLIQGKLLMYLKYFVRK